MYCIVGTPKSIEDLAGNTNPTIDISKVREKQRVLVIDDSAFSNLENLKKNRYQIDHVSDLESITMVEGYTIILCDINGVGRKLGGKNGAHLISEIKKSFPLKPLIAFSSQTFSPEYNRYIRLADSFIKKDIDLETWIETLDDVSKNIVDPIYQWKRARNLLFDKGMRTKDILKLENLFVSSINDKEKLNQIATNSLVKMFAPDVRAIVQGLIANLIFRLVVGGH
jgi:hypothetical protein